MIKRLFDILFSLWGLFALSPMLLFIAIWIKIDDQGPVFFRQERIGKNGKSFKILKFRSMKMNSEQMGQLTVGGRDPRITNAGYFLRKFKLDELAQLFNVLKGDMSFVGPRPEVPKYVAMYNEEQRKVLTVKPGITDWASLKYFEESELLAAAEDPEACYVQEIMPAKLKINLDYVENYSLFTDLKIILLTVFKIFQ